jgi:predicted phosphodiesterase
MKIAVMSDSHDHLENIEKAVALAMERGAEMLLHCGDLCSPFVVDKLAPFDGLIETNKGLVAFTHYPEHGKGRAATGKYSAVFSGHIHIRMSEVVNGTPHVNPGEIMGLIERPGFVIFDLESGESETVEI